MFLFSDQDHADEADDEIVGESDQPGGDEVVDGATPATSQPSHVAGLGFKRFGDETINLSSVNERIKVHLRFRTSPTSSMRPPRSPQETVRRSDTVRQRMRQANWPLPNLR